MARTHGATDKKKRKRRSDIGKQHKTFRGKPTKPKRKKNGNFVPYIPSGQKKEYYEIRWMQKLPMNPDSYLNFHYKTRNKMFKYVFPWRHRSSVPIRMIDTKEKLLDWCASPDSGISEGTWYLHGGSHGKNKRRFTWKTACVLYVRATDDGLKAIMLENRRLFRYKWYKG